MTRSMTTNPNPQACLACRSKHLKCDAKQPKCDRCTTNHVDCVYVRSKRGYVGGRRGKRQPTGNEQLGRSVGSSEFQSHQSWPVSQHVAPTKEDGLFDGSTPGSDNTVDAENQGLPDPLNDRLVHLYYQHIHPAHPFLVPYKLLMQSPDIIPIHLYRTIQFIARLLHRSHSWNAEEFQRILNSSSILDGFQIQTLLLLTIAAYAHGERAQGNRAIRLASENAQQIGINSDYFDTGYSPTLRESWRRTWWELYSVSGMLRVITPSIPKLQTPYNRSLPCHDVEYESCQPTQSRSFDQMQQRHFAEDDFSYSSFAYRIESVRILGDVLEFASQDSQEAQPLIAFNAHKAAIRSYILSLPGSAHTGGETADARDQLMFCAVATVNLASMLLNLPRSSLPVTRFLSTACQTKRATAFTHDSNCTIAAVDAANAIVQLLIDHSAEPTQSTSPCFSCVLTFATTVHLLSYYHTQDQARSRYLKEYIQVSLGSLNSMGQTWPIARVVKGQLAEFAREIFANQAASPPRIDTRQEDADPMQVLGPPFDTRDDLWLQDFVNTELNLYVPA